MSKSIVYNGVDFGEFTHAKVVQPVGQQIALDTLAVPGRRGVLLRGWSYAPKVFQVTLALDRGVKESEVAMEGLRNAVAAALCAPSGAFLFLPTAPDRGYIDTVCTNPGAWESLLEEGKATLEFTAYNPVAYGVMDYSNEETFTIGGTAPVYFVVLLTLDDDTNSLKLSNAATGEYVEIKKAMSAGSELAVFMSEDRVLLGDEDISADVTLGSTFFMAEPGEFTLEFTPKCSTFGINYIERWL